MTELAAKIDPKSFGISHERGILPALDPLDNLPGEFAVYDEFGRQLPDFLATETIRKRAAELPRPVTPITELSYWQKILLMLRVSSIVSAYVHANAYREFVPKRIYTSSQETEIIIPKNLALPLIEVAESLEMPAILSYFFYAAANWKKLNQFGEIEIANLAPLQLFYGGVDERHFILNHVEIERALGPALYLLPHIQYHTKSLDMAGYIAQLLDEKITPAIENAVGALRRMRELCHPDIYYIRVRPFIFGFNLTGSRRVLYEGTNNEAHQAPVLRGETGAQTSSFPALWAAMGIEFSNDRLKEHVLYMRNYMLPSHRAYIETIEKGPSLRKYVLNCVDQKISGVKSLKDAYNRSISALHDYFKLHRYYAYLYIHQKRKKYVLHAEQGEYGTGGTPFMQYLAQHCAEILAHRIK